ncbi:transcriptional regulator [Clostridium aceticum]|uniref:Transcriptional regulator n=1 Tax=Clostridium aceticum TaxID=84022 RepID=A0A0D8I914_9CLOT|nr:GntR family transcriptional regulator [Clostridium aceticum]AKL95880.1 transcriptional regulator [Clostridium aceticum]KJF26534.1 hypothetical protein TZ02_12690 [Clostridium aceticum]
MKIYEKKKDENPKEYIYRLLKDNIMELELKPGTILSENELSKILNVSRTPIREVLRRLNNEHLIEIMPQTGTMVTYIDRALIDEVLFMRFVLEKEIIKLLQDTITTEEVNELENLLSLQEFYMNKSMIIDFHKYDTKFHEKLFAISKKTRVWESIINLSTHYARARLLYDHNHNTAQKSIIIQHRKILTAITEKASYQEIEEILREHILAPCESWSMEFEKIGVNEYFLEMKNT